MTCHSLQFQTKQLNLQQKNFKPDTLFKSFINCKKMEYFGMRILGQAEAWGCQVTWRAESVPGSKSVRAVGSSRARAVRLVDHRLYDPPSRVDEPAEHTNQHVVVGDRNDVVKHQFHAK